jgi:hypothetical protein
MFKYIFVWCVVVHFIGANQAQDIPEQNHLPKLSILPYDVTSQVFPYLTLVERQSLHNCGDKIIQNHIRAFEHYEVEAIMAKNADLNLISDRKRLCAALPFAPEDYSSRYNLIMNFDKIATITHKLGRKFQQNFKKILVPSIFDFMVSLGNEEAIDLKFIGLLTGKYGYQKDIHAAHHFLEEQSLLGSQKANSLLFEKLRGSSHFLKKDEPRAFDLLDTHVQARHSWALQTHYNLLNTNGHFYIQNNTPAARVFLLGQMALGNLWALRTFLETETRFLNRHETPETKHYKRDIIEQQYQQRYAWAKPLKLDAIYQGYYDVTSPQKKAKSFLKKGVRAEEDWAVHAYLKGLTHGCYGIKKNLRRLHRYVDKKCQEGNLLFIKEKYDLHTSAFSKCAWDQDSIPDLLRAASRQGETWAIIAWFERVNLSQNASPFVPDLLLRAYNIKIIEPILS